jgi:hypothetical protein
MDQTPNAYQESLLAPNQHKPQATAPSEPARLKYVVLVARADWERKAGVSSASTAESPGYDHPGSGRSSSVCAGSYAEPSEQVCEELLKQGAGALAVLEFGGAEAENLVSTELEVPVAAHVGCVPGAIRSSVRASEVLGSVHFEDDSLTMGQEEQEVHPESQQGPRAALADRFRIPMQPYLGQKGGEVLHRAAVDLVV